MSELQLNSFRIQLNLYSLITNRAVLKGIYFCIILQLPNPSLTCLSKYIRFIWQSLDYKINCLCNSAVLNKTDFLTYAKSESSDQSAV